MTAMFYEIILKLNKYRINVYLLFVSVVAVYWAWLPIADRMIVWALGFSYLLVNIWIYLFNKVFDHVEDKVSQPKEVVTDKDLKFLKVFNPLLLVSAFAILLYLGLDLLPMLIYAGLGFFYSYPLIGDFRLKNIPILKNAMASLSVVLPIWSGIYIYFQDYYTYVFTYDIKYLVSLLLLFFVGEMIWDIRDVDGDRSNGVKTIPVLFGVKVTKFFCLLLITIALLMTGFTMVKLIIAIILVVLVSLVTPQTNPLYYHLPLYAVSVILLLYLLL